jgi:hypothetical protein
MDVTVARQSRGRPHLRIRTEGEQFYTDCFLEEAQDA